MKSPRFTLDQLRPALQEQVVAILHPSKRSNPPPTHEVHPGPVRTAAAGGGGLKTQRKGQRVARVRNGATWTEAAYWGHLRSWIRQAFRWWKPAAVALKAAKLPGRDRYLCADCKKLFPRKRVQIDHVVPVGQLLCLDDLAGFLRRLTPEDPAAYQILCAKCHCAKSASDAMVRNGKPNESSSRSTKTGLEG